MTFLKDAAKWYSNEPHQDRAWELLEAQLPKWLLREFMDAYRDSPEPVKPIEPVVTGVIITKQTFEALTGYRADLFTDTEVRDCNMLLEETGFGESPELASMLLANILHETGNLRWMKELSDGWAYENRADLGNVQPGDGPRYKGAGVLQLTGRYNYSVAAKVLKDSRVMEGVDYVSTTYPFRSAIPWIEQNRLLEIAKRDGFEAVCVRINGGYNGYEDRKAKLRICRDVLC